MFFVTQAPRGRAHDVGDTADGGRLHERVDRAALRAQIVAEGLERDVEAKLVPVLEAVRDGLLPRCNTYDYALELVLLHPVPESTANTLEPALADETRQSRSRHSTCDISRTHDTVAHQRAGRSVPGGPRFVGTST